MESLQDLLGTALTEERLRHNLASYATILDAIRKLRLLDLTDTHPAIVYDPLLPYREDPE